MNPMAQASTHQEATAVQWLARLRLGEDTGLELKSVAWRSAGKIEGPHPDSLADELAAMANAQGGVVVLGVDDTSKQVLGIAYERLDTVETWLAQICNDRIKPPLDIVTQHIELPDETGQLRAVIVVTVPRSLMVHKSPNGYFKRVGHAKREMAPDVLARLFQQRSQSRLIRFDEQPVPNTRLDMADALLVQKFLREGEGAVDLQLQRLHLTALAPELDYNHAAPAPCLSLAGVLLCTVKPTRWLPSAYIQAVAYSGEHNDPHEQLNAQDIEGPLDAQVWAALAFVRQHMRTPASKALGRVDYPQYSERAVFEALVNAVAHRDYSITGGRIRLHLFSDRLELYSPGGLLNSMTIEAMRVMSMPRNEVIASLFSRYFPTQDAGLGRGHLMDRRGAGVDLILSESTRLSGIKPTYQQISEMELQLTIFAAKPPETHETPEGVTTTQEHA
jgi:ATP-dependent DNA helicase RecG